ncbi:MAG: hypothetical protein ACI8P9_003711 [Parasphingorhabdus sp.]
MENITPTETTTEAVRPPPHPTVYGELIERNACRLSGWSILAQADR